MKPKGTRSWTVWVPVKVTLRHPQTGAVLLIENTSQPPPVYVPVDFIGDLTRTECEAVAKMRHGPNAIVCNRNKQEPAYATLERLRPPARVRKLPNPVLDVDEYASADEAYERGFSEGIEQADDTLRESAENNGFNQGFAAGWEEGWRAAQAELMERRWFEMVDPPAEVLLAEPAAAQLRLRAG